MIGGVLATLAVWAALWASGAATARLLFGPRASRVARFARLPLGLAALTLVLEALGYFLPIRLAALPALLLPLAGFVWLARSRALPRFDAVLVGVGALALLLGLLPIFVAGRATAAALTNNDATFYVSAAERLTRLPWRVDEGLPGGCMTERVLHGWYWRTGTANLIAAVAQWTRLSSTAALAVVTALQIACVPWTALSLAAALGFVGRQQRLLIGVLASLSAAPLFLGYQHLLGQLGAYVLFPLACAATLSAVRRGGKRRIAHAALLLGAGVAVLADAAPALLLALVAAVLAGAPRVLPALPRAAAIGLAALCLAPSTLVRAGYAAWGTLRYRAFRVEPVFPQRGWLPRSPVDDLATLTGVDSWPPWPSAWPPTPNGVAAWVGALVGTALLAVGWSKLRSASGARPLFALLAACTLFAVARGEPRYLVGKVLLMGAAFAVPVCAVGAAALLARRRARLLVPCFALAELVAIAPYLRPGAWKVVDRPDHDALVAGLAALPAGELLVLDGFGAPTDAVLDEHRAYRAALLAGLEVIQPGLDGGFYRPRCSEPPLPWPPWTRVWALSRAGAENLSRGPVHATYGTFTLREIDRAANQIAATWAPTHGWLAAEREPDGHVFRWAEARARAALRVAAPEGCFTLDGAARTAGPAGRLSAMLGESSLYEGPIDATWQPLRTRSLRLTTEASIDLTLSGASAPPPDVNHVFALRDLRVELDARCASLWQIDRPGVRPTFPDLLEEPRSYVVEAALGVACGQVLVRVRAGARGQLGVSFEDGATSWHYVDHAGLHTIAIERRDLERALRVTLSQRASAPSLLWTVDDVSVRPKDCGGA